MDFAAILVIAALVTGGIWLLDIFVLAPRRAQAASTAPKGREVKLPWYVDFSRSFFPIILAVLLLRSFIVEPFRIPSGSMMPTLLAGDFILVNKFAYGVRLPVVNTKIIDSGSPQRGDVVVFRYPEDPSVAYIKRVVGLPGDYLEYRNKQLSVNGEPVPQHPLPAVGDAVAQGYEFRMETLGNVNHPIQIRKSDDLSWGYSVDLSRGYKVPEGYYFMMGDNRDNSRDSRFWGPLPEGNLIGKAFLIWMNLDCITLQGHCNRIGRTIE
jgi:signal peptidase I